MGIIHIFVYAESFSASSAICITSSRVGAIIKAKGVPAFLALNSGFSIWYVIIEIRKAAVFPVPVCACAMISEPSNDCGRTSYCIGVQSLNPSSLIACSNSHGRSNSVKSFALFVTDSPKSFFINFISHCRVGYLHSR